MKNNEMKQRFLIIILCLLSVNIGLSQSREKSFNVKMRYINIPIEQKQIRQQVVFKVDGEKYTYNDIRVANDTVDYWTFTDVSKFLGKKFTLNFPKDVSGIDKIYQSDKFVGQENIYKESLRPQVHYTTKRGWTNDPNGMVYYEGEYHLFYQHNPYEINWGNMTWGHAVSKDLLHWEELPIALLPDEMGTMFSGSAVIDYKNTSGFGSKKNPAMVAMFTADLRKGGKELGQHQGIAYSLDKGRTFTKYEGNPVIPMLKRFGSGHERDPKVFWYEPGKHWVMIMHEGLTNGIYNSKDLKKWEHTCTVDAGYWECPELFELPVDGDKNNKKWIVYGVQGIYQIGSFDGKVFTPETEMLRYNLPPGMTAAQSFNDEPNGRRIQIGWGHAGFQGMPFKQTFTFPMEFSLKTSSSGVRLFVEPVKELKNLHSKSVTYNNEYIGDALNKKLEQIKSPFLHIKTTIEIENSVSFGMNINGYKLNYSVARNTLNDNFIPLKNRQLELEIIVDNNLLEVYVNGGLFYWFANNTKGDLKNFKLSFIKGGNPLNKNSKTLVKHLKIHELKSIWE